MEGPGGVGVLMSVTRAAGFASALCRCGAMGALPSILSARRSVGIVVSLSSMRPRPFGSIGVQQECYSSAVSKEPSLAEARRHPLSEIRACSLEVRTFRRQELAGCCTNLAGLAVMRATGCEPVMCSSTDCGCSRETGEVAFGLGHLGCRPYSVTLHEFEQVVGM